MATWFECRFKFNREDEQGGYKSVTETFLIDAVSFTEAETRVYSEVASNLRDFKLLKIAHYKVDDISIDTNRTWYKCKVAMTTIDEKSGKEKKVKQIVLANAGSIEEASSIVNDIFSTALSNFTSVAISETNIVEVLHYNKQ